MPSRLQCLRQSEHVISHAHEVSGGSANVRRGRIQIVAASPPSDETDGGFPRNRQARVAAGFVLTSVRYRLQDAADLWWRLADKVLVSQAWWDTSQCGYLSCSAVALVVNPDGIYGVIANYENLASLTARYSSRSIWADGGAA